jgi:hypothetical protein
MEMISLMSQSAAKRLAFDLLKETISSQLSKEQRVMLEKTLKTQRAAIAAGIKK